MSYVRCFIHIDIRIADSVLKHTDIFSHTVSGGIVNTGFIFNRRFYSHIIRTLFIVEGVQFYVQERKRT